MAAIAQKLDRGGDDKQYAEMAIHLVAARLGFSDHEALTLIRTLGEDGQVDLLWELYTSETPGAVLANTSTDERKLRIS